MVDPSLDLESVLSYSRESGRVCPKPQLWSELYELLPNRRRKGAGFAPSAPLILAGWWHSTDGQKRGRLACHIRYADEHGVLVEVARFLFALDDSDWHHDGD